MSMRQPAAGVEYAKLRAATGRQSRHIPESVEDEEKKGMVKEEKDSKRKGAKVARFESGDIFGHFGSLKQVRKCLSRP